MTHHDRDPLLSKVRSWTLKGWPSRTLEEQFQSFVRLQQKLRVEGGCVLWRNRVVVLVKGRDKVLDMLHEAHPGIVQMKTFSRGFVWWPEIDGQIENRVKNCSTCQQDRHNVPAVPLHPWTRPQKTWSSI